MNCALQFCLLLGLLVSVSTAERTGYESEGQYHVAKRAALADFRKRFEGWHNVDTEERGHGANHGASHGARHGPKRRHHGKGEHEGKRAALADFKRAALADFKRAALADFKRAALADFKRAALADFKRAALADFKRAALADFKRSHHGKSEGHEGAKNHHHRNQFAGSKHGHKRQLYWDICTKMENGQEKYYACQKSL